MKKLLFAAFALFALQATAQPPLKHSVLGTSVRSDDGQLPITSVDKRQNYSGGDAQTRETAVNSPKSANIHPNGKKYYINSLEGCATVVFEMGTNRKLKTINHNFTDQGSEHLWAKPSGLYKWHKQWNNPNTFMGKPVEATFSHAGRYLWVPYYRRTYDNNAV